MPNTPFWHEPTTIGGDAQPPVLSPFNAEAHRRSPRSGQPARTQSCGHHGFPIRVICILNLRLHGSSQPIGSALPGFPLDNVQEPTR